jgi:hypothetical protein
MGMEDDTRVFLIKILHTISIVLLWMIANVFLGIYNEFAFFTGSPGWKNYLFYFFSLATLAALAVHLWRKWKL